MSTNIQQPPRKQASFINHPPQPYVGDLSTRPLATEPLPQRQQVPNKSRIVRTSQSSKTVSFLFCVAILLALPIATVLINQQTNYQQHAVANTANLLSNGSFKNTPGKDLYGIAAGGSMISLSSTDLNHYLDDYKTLGTQWLRFDFAWPYIQPNSSTSYDWTANDAVVNAATSRGIKVLGIIDYTPQWELPSGCTDVYHCPPKNNADYATFAATVAARYASVGVHYWEIWNEPNGNTFTPAGYTAMLKAAYPAIKQADPSAFVLAGGSMPSATGGGSYSPVDFLTGMYQNGAKGYFDALAHHPYCFAGSFNCPTTFEQWSAWSQMQDTNPSLRSVMTANGDQNKQIWATEFGAPTGGSSQGVSESQQAQMVTDAYTLFNSYSWAGPLFWYAYKDLCTTTTDIECYFGLVRPDYSQKPSYAAYQTLATAAISTLTPTPTPADLPSPTNTPAPSFTPTSTPENWPSPTNTPTPSFTPKKKHGHCGIRGYGWVWPRRICQRPRTL
jgi:polysaccharide biosynthesis protein PslG